MIFIAGSTFLVSWSAWRCSKFNVCHLSSETDAVYLLLERVLAIIVAFVLFSLLDTRFLLLDLFVVACFFFDQAEHNAGCYSELGRRGHDECLETGCETGRIEINFTRDPAFVCTSMLAIVVAC